MRELTIGAVKFYRHSGKAPLLGLILLGLFGFIAIPILGLVYGYVIYYMPFIVINIILVLLYAVVVSSLINKAITLGKVRNVFLVGFVTFSFALFAEYVGWIAWIAAVGKDASYLLEFFFPLEVFRIIVEIGQVGVWSISDITPTGSFLYFIWILESITVVGGIVYLTLKSFLEVPFCEESDAWANKKSGLAAFAPITNPNQFKLSVSQGMFSAFNELKPIQSGSTFTLFELYECEACNNFFVLNIKDVKISMDRKRRQNRKEKKIVSNLIVSPSVISAIKKLMEEYEKSRGEQAVTA